MKQSVRDAFYDFNAPLEGAVPYLYQDVLGLVSIGVGILCDPIQLAMNLPMVHADGRPADRSEIAAEWLRIKGLGSGDHTQGNEAARLGHRYARPHTRLRLTEEGLRSTLAGKLHIHDVHLRKRFHDFEAWPADAQLAIHSWAWGVGPAAPYPRMTAALLARDFRAAAEQIRMVANGVELHGLKPRNRANRTLMINAAVVQDEGLDPDVLYWPRDLSVAPVDPDADTQPELVPVMRPAPLQSTTVVDFGVVRNQAEALEADRERHRRERDDEPPDDAA